MVAYNTHLKESCFSFLQEDEAQILLDLMDERICNAGSHLFMRGDSADCLYLVVSGKIAVQKRTGFGKRTQVVALLGPGAPVGESGLLEKKVRGSTLLAVQDSKLLVLQKASFLKLSSENNDLAIKTLKWLLERVVMRLQKNSERLAHVL
jgi:CRP-like cAMP-binding protein